MNVVKFKEMLIFLITYFNNIVISQNINGTKIDYELIFTFLCISHSFCSFCTQIRMLWVNMSIKSYFCFHIFCRIYVFICKFLFSTWQQNMAFLECLFLCMIKTRHANKMIWPSALIIKGYRVL